MLYQAVPKNDVPEILGQLSKEFFTPPRGLTYLLLLKMKLLSIIMPVA